MSAHDELVVGLEIGTSKICVLVGELVETGAVSIVGMGVSASRGVRKGEIVDFRLASDAIREAVARAENNCEVEIGSVFLSVTGSHIASFDSMGTVAITNAEGAVEQDHMERAIELAKNVSLPRDHEIVHTIRQQFYVDGNSGVVNPLRISGRMLEAEVHVVHGIATRLQNSVRAVVALDIDVEDIVLSGLASGLAVLDREQKNLGALVIDIGGGTTDYVAYASGAIRHAGVVAVGGDHVTNDLALGLKIPAGKAHILKDQHGRVDQPPAQIEDRPLELPEDFGFATRTCSFRDLCAVMRCRYEELFQIIRDKLAAKNLKEFFGSGVILTGGASRARGIIALAEDVFELPATLGMPRGYVGLKTATDTPECATAAGLIRYAFRARRARGDTGSRPGGGRWPHWPWPSRVGR